MVEKPETAKQIFLLVNRKAPEISEDNPWGTIQKINVIT